VAIGHCSLTLQKGLWNYGVMIFFSKKAAYYDSDGDGAGVTVGAPPPPGAAATAMAAGAHNLMTLVRQL